MPHVNKMLECRKDKGYKEKKKNNKKEGYRMRCILDVPRSFGKYANCPKLVAPHITCCASCPKLKSKTNLFKKIANKTKQNKE